MSIAADGKSDFKGMRTKCMMSFRHLWVLR